jgi:hypothetical protein
MLCSFVPYIVSVAFSGVATASTYKQKWGKGKSFRAVPTRGMLSENVLKHILMTSTIRTLKCSENNRNGVNHEREVCL